MSTETVTPEIDMQTVFRTVSAQEDAPGTISDLAFALMLVAEGLHTSAERGAVARLALYVSDHAERAETLRHLHPASASALRVARQPEAVSGFRGSA